MSTEQKQIMDIDVHKLNSMRQAGEAHTLLDIRELSELTPPEEVSPASLSLIIPVSSPDENDSERRTKPPERAYISQNLSSAIIHFSSTRSDTVARGSTMEFERTSI